VVTGVVLACGDDAGVIALQHRARVHVAFMTDHDAVGHWIGTAIEFMSRHGTCWEAVAARGGDGAHAELPRKPADPGQR
jgi:hypothetical protein